MNEARATTNQKKNSNDYGFSDLSNAQPSGAEKSPTNHPNSSLVFFGSGPVAAASLQNLADTFNVEFVVTKRKPAHHKDPAPVETLANKYSLPVLFADTKAELETLLSITSFTSKVGVVIDYGVIISKTAIDLFEHGILNSHFSILPEWRGADPITFSLLSGQSQTGVSLMLIDEGLDTGYIIAETPVIINSNDTGVSLTTKLIEASDGQISAILPLYIEGTAKAMPQDTQNRTVTYSRKLTKTDGTLNFNKPATVLEREIRAYSDWPKSRTALGLVEVIITKAHVIDVKNSIGSIVITDDKQLLLGTKVGTLVVTELMPLGKQKMTTAAFLNGYGSRIL